MKKRTLLGSAFALAMASMLGGTASVPVRAENAQIAQTNGSGSGSTTEQPTTANDERPVLASVDKYGNGSSKPTWFPQRQYAKWCSQAGSGKTNTIKRSRRLRRKHRRS
ncbi:hypothetical protein BN8_01352 [Fibrisoma limi BUZ 3]|uniref:Uncharacterized protein n=1 Tax=Fibrisoma limi BUZ 3 TaxID=1185876 RepID=I2GEN1_9BACT|nr:hypothetical protein [Fibrisoma limi]CCH52356.1 hypothetical protein BN8_01352 [Fibrisoma limi BUZ 3]